MDEHRGRIEQTSDSTIEAPKKIVGSIQSARAVYAALREKHLKRIGLYAEIEGLIQGNPPYSANDLAKAGLSHISNFNDMSARALYERYCLSYWNLLNNSEHLVNFKVNFPGVPETAEIAKILSRNWDYAVKNHWRSFIVNVASLCSQLVKFGISPAFFPDERDPRWRVIELNKFFIPDQAQSDIDLLTTIAIETEFTVQYLYNIYQEFKDTPDSPWNTKEIAHLLVQLANDVNKGDNDVYDQLTLERMVLNGDIRFDSLYSDSIRLISLFQKEYDGKISHYMFHRNIDKGDFLFHEPSQYNEMAEALVLFTIHPGEYTIHSNRGLGHKIYSLAQAKIMLDCSVVDMAKWASTPIIKSPSLTTKDSDQIRFYPGVPTNIGTADFVQNNLGSNVSNVVGAAQYLSNLMQFNLTYSGSDPGQPDPDHGSLSPTQTKLMAFREFSVMKNSIMHFYSIFDMLVQNMTAKMLRCREGDPGYVIAKTWKDRCLAEGVPEVVFDIKSATKDAWGLPPHIEVYATRAAGAGSQLAHLMGLQELQPIVGSFGPREEREFKRQIISATIGPEYIDTFMQESDDVDELSGGASLAGVENAIMQAGKPATFSKDNEHRAHFTIHMGLCQEVIQALQEQQMDVIEADSIFAVVIPHTEQHLAALAENVFAQQFFAQARAVFEDVARYAALNKRNAERAIQAQIRQQQEQAAEQERVMSEEELKTMQVLNEEKRKDYKLAAQTQRQEKAGQAKEEALRRKTDVDVQIKQQKAAADAGVKQALTNTAVQDTAADPLAAMRARRE